MNLKYQTLHAHTTTSDGVLTYNGLLKECEKNDIGVVAFTDHDSLLNKRNLKLLKNTNFKTKWISGVEVSSGWPLDLGGGATGGLHIVGLFVNPFDRNLVKHSLKAKEARILRMQKIVKNLHTLGLSITEKDCLKASGGESVGRPHIVTAIKSYEENQSVINSLVEKLKKGSLTDLKLKEKYDYMVGRGESQYPYELFLSDEAYVGGIYVDYQYYLDFDKTVQLIRSAGGVSILAHWSTCRYKLTDKYIDTMFKDNRVDGAETVYSLDSLKIKNNLNRKKELKILTDIVVKNNKLQSGGADAHTPLDLKEFSEAKWFSQKTIGFAESIIRKSKVDKTWSSF